VGHSAILKELAAIDPIILAPTDTMLNVKVFDRKFQILIPSRSDWDAPETPLPANGLVFYTDGSLFEGTAGSGVYSEEINLNLSFFHGCHATVFQTEIHAILACNEFCKRVIPCQTSKNKTKMSPWVENFKIDIFRGFYIQF
jgi:hypothetical protein